MKEKLTKEQQKELEMLAAEIEAEAIQMKIDYENNPSEMSGSIVVVHEESEYLDEEE
jgi:transcriptional regulator of heat shock response|tara:strand:+ start:197 stop:367 length:171 start_codon:yes stop_codon:yes gene_type:complete